MFEKGVLKSDETRDTDDENGTYIFFQPDGSANLFKNYSFHDDIVETMLRNYTYLNTGLTIMYNGRRILSRHGLKDLLIDNMTEEPLYPIVHMRGEDIEIAFTHTKQYGEEYHSFVNGQHTTQGGATRRRSRSISHVPSRSSSESMSTATFVTDLSPPSPSMWKSPSSSRRQRLSSAHTYVTRR